MTEQDAAKGWMSQPTELEDMTQVEQLLCPRFIVEQTKEDGTKKLRAIDNLSWGAKSAMDASLQEKPLKKMRKSVSVNGHVSVNEKLKHHTLDDFVQLLRAFYRSVGCLPAMLKADIDAAFRRIPIAADSRWACGVAFASGDKVCIIAFLVPLWGSWQCTWLGANRCSYSAHCKMVGCRPV